jgi:hypothetical protein
MRTLLIPYEDQSRTTRIILGVCAVLLMAVSTYFQHKWFAVTGVLLADANQVVNPSWVMKQIGLRLVNNVKFAGNVQRSYDSQYVQSGAKIGYTVSARLPQRYKVNKGQALNPQPVIDNIVPITLTDQANVGIEFSTASLTMEVENYKEKCIAPAVDALVNTADYDGLSRMYQVISQTVGVPGTPATTNSTYLDAGVKLDNSSVPEGERVAILAPAQHAAIANANLTLFNPTQEISKLYRKGQFGSEALGISEWFKDQNVATHTVGPLGGAPQVDGANQAGSTVLTKGWTATTASRLKAGDVIQFAGVYAVNPLSYQSTGQLKDFVITQDFSDAAGAGNINFSPAMILIGALQNVSALPADSANITIFGHASNYASKVTPQALVYHPEAFAMVMADLEMPQGVWVSERISNQALGVAIRFIKDYNIMTDMSPARVDILYGWKEVRPEMACRVCG